MKKSRINSSGFAERMGSYSHGYKVDLGNTEIIFTTGQLALDKNGKVVAPNDIAAQTEFVFESLQKILKEANSSLDDVVKATIFVTDMDDFKLVSPIRNKYFKISKPVSTLIEVSKLVTEGCKVEIEVIAVKQKG